MSSGRMNNHHEKRRDYLWVLHVCGGAVQCPLDGCEEDEGGKEYTKLGQMIYIYVNTNNRGFSPSIRGM